MTLYKLCGVPMFLDKFDSIFEDIIPIDIKISKEDLCFLLNHTFIVDKRLFSISKNATLII